MTKFFVALFLATGLWVHSDSSKEIGRVPHVDRKSKIGCQAHQYFQDGHGTWNFYDCNGACTSPYPQCGIIPVVFITGHSSINGYVCTCYNPVNGTFLAPDFCGARIYGDTYPGWAGFCDGPCEPVGDYCIGMGSPITKCDCQ